jgi:hypothetical protein
VVLLTVGIFLGGSLLLVYAGYLLDNRDKRRLLERTRKDANRSCAHRDEDPRLPEGPAPPTPTMWVAPRHAEGREDLGLDVFNRRP